MTNAGPVLLAAILGPLLTVGAVQQHRRRSARGAAAALLLADLDARKARGRRTR